MATNQNATKAATFPTVLVCRRFGCFQKIEFVAVLMCRRFGFVAILVVSKTVTCTVLDTGQHSILDKLDLSLFRHVAILIVSKIVTRQNGDMHHFGWHCFGCRRFGVSPF